MKNNWISIFFLAVYIAILLKVMVFKDIPMIRVGQIMLNFGGTNPGTEANFIPFKTILPYLLGYKGLIIAGINLVGNVALLVPLGFLVPFIYTNMTWRKSVLMGVIAGFSIEIMQVILRAGIFDIDDVILNAFGFTLGYLTFVFLTMWISERKYLNILIAGFVLAVAMVGAFFIVYPFGQPVTNSEVHADRVVTPESGDLCGGTGGNGEVVSIGDQSFTLLLNNDKEQLIKLADRAEINTAAGPGSLTDLKIGDRVTLVGGPNPDKSFTADAVFICNPPTPEINK